MRQSLWTDLQSLYLPSPRRSKKSLYEALGYQFRALTCIFTEKKPRAVQPGTKTWNTVQTHRTERQLLYSTINVGAVDQEANKAERNDYGTEMDPKEAFLGE